MKSLLARSALMTVMVILTACKSDQIGGSGKIVADTREIGDFTGVSLSTGILILKQGFKTSLTIQGDDNLIDQLKSEVRNGILYIEPHDHITLIPSHPFTFYVTIRDLDQLILDNRVEARTLEQILGDYLEIKAGGMSRISMDIAMEKLALNAVGKAKVELKGECINQYAKLADSSVYNGLFLQSENATVVLFGESTAVVNVLRTLDVNLQGSTSLKYRGKPRLTKQIEGTGSIKQIP